ncbi:MAG TPA: site-specific DNA-methyltransferase [Burkholderiales bacterium]|nr:site-specific DNA-methyltransferase [Burkholderiales bacterium]
MNDLTIFDQVRHFQSTADTWFGNTTNGIPWAVFCGDAVTTLSRIPIDTYDCAVTSPPYYWLRDYAVDGQIGQEETVEQYVGRVVEVMDEVKRVLKPHALLFLNLGDTYYSGRGKSHGVDKKSSKRRFGLRAVDKSGGLGIGLQKKSMIGIPWRVAIEMCRRGWILRSPIIWHRHRSLPEAVIDRASRSYEFVFMFAKNRKYYFDRRPLIDQKVEEDMWTIMARPKSTNGIDTAPFPDELVQRCLDIGCKPDGAVLDPFCGSGTTLRVALTSGRRASGIDLNRAFCEYAARELQRY